MILTHNQALTSCVGCLSYNESTNERNKINVHENSYTNRHYSILRLDFLLVALTSMSCVPVLIYIICPLLQYQSSSAWLSGMSI